MRAVGRTRRDGGFTLIELLVAISVMGIIMAPLAAATIIYYRTNAATVDRLAESHDAQIAQVYFARDVQRMGVRTLNPGATSDWAKFASRSIEIDAPATGGLYHCGTASRPGHPGTPRAVVRLAWSDLDTGQPVIVSYVVPQTNGGGSPRELHRLTCDATGATVDDVVVVHNIHPHADPTVQCKMSATDDWGACPLGGSTPPLAVRLTLYVQAPSGPSGGTCGGSYSNCYTVILDGQRRQTS